MSRNQADSIQFFGDNSSSVAYAHGAIWSLSDASGMHRKNGTEWAFYNDGRFRKTSGKGTVNIFANFVSTGAIDRTGDALSLNDLADFHAAVTSFDHLTNTDALLMRGVWSFAGASKTASAATLPFTRGSTHQSLTLLGDYVGGAFSATKVGGKLKVTH